MDICGLGKKYQPVSVWVRGSVCKERNQVPGMFGNTFVEKGVGAVDTEAKGARQPVSAIECFDMAIAADPALFVAHLSRRNLAMTMVNEKAPELPGRPAWGEIAAEASREVRRTKKSSIRRLLRLKDPFSTYHVMHVFEPGPYCPAISCTLAPYDVRETAARSMLAAGHAAFQEAKYEMALDLARRAGAASPRVKPPAETLAAAAEAKVVELKCDRDARRYAQALGGFFDSLRLVDVDPDAPREHLGLLEAHETNLAEHLRLYHERVAEGFSRRYRESSDEDERTWLLALVGQFSRAPMSTAYGKAANVRLARPFLNAFWAACTDRDTQAAALALEQAEASVGTSFDELRRVLRALDSMSLIRTQPEPPEGPSPSAQGSGATSSATDGPSEYEPFGSSGA